MADTVDKEKRSSIMRAVKSKDTSPEIYVRRALHSMGFRFRLHVKNLPGKPDLIFARFKTVVFVNGCFWHWHGCTRTRMPKSNTEYWTKKIKKTVQRDEQNYQLLKAQGWTVKVIWDCDLESDLTELMDYLASLR